MRTPLLYATALVFVLAAAGCGGGGGLPGSSANPNDGSNSGNNGGNTATVTADVLAPAITGQRLSAATLDFRGGAVTISADVTDPSGVQSVVASVQKSNGGPLVDVPLTLRLGASYTYEGTYSIPANQNATAGSSDSYTVTIRATDLKGNLSATTPIGTVTVTAPQADDPLPPPPVFPATP